MRRTKPDHHRLAVCIRNRGYRASLETGKIYRIVPDAEAAEHGYLRVVDESGEDYLYPNDSFILISLPRSVQATLLHSLWPAAS